MLEHHHGRTALVALTALLALVFLLSSAGQALAGKDRAQAPFEVAPESETVFRLANGLTVYLIRDTRFPMVCMRLFVRAGSASEDRPELYGIAHTVEHMVFKGTEHFPGVGTAARTIESLGGSLNAHTSTDRTVYEFDLPARHWKTGLALIGDMAFFPLFSAEDLENEKPVIISELEGREDDPFSRLLSEQQEAVLTGTPYGHPVIGHRESVSALTPDMLKEFRSRWYQPQNVMLVVAGDIDMDEVHASVEKQFGGLRNTTVLTAEKPVNPPSVAPAERVGVTRGAWGKVYLSLAVPMTGSADMASLDMELLSFLLAGDGTSLLERRYHLDRQLVDGIGVYAMPFESAGLLLVDAVLDADRLEEVFTSLVRDLKDLDVKAFSKEELGRALFQLVDELDRNAETLGDMTYWRGEAQFFRGGRQGEANMRAYLETVDLDRLASSWQRFMRPERLRARLLAPEGADLPDLAAILDREWPMPPAGSDEGTKAEEKRERLTLPNGVELVLLPDSSMPYLSLTLAAPGGYALQKEGTEEGLATLTAELLTEGAGGMDRLEFARRLAAGAMDIAVDASAQSFSVSASGPSAHENELLDLIKVMLESPRFDESEFARSVIEMNNARILREEDPINRLRTRVRSAYYGSHPYGRDSLGTEESLAALSRDKVSSFWQLQRAMSWKLAVAGSFDREAVLAWAALLPEAAEKPPVIPELKLAGPKSLTVPMEDVNEAHLLKIYQTVERTHPDAPAMLLLSSVLNGQAGLLFLRMRDEQSLGYTVAFLSRQTPVFGLSQFYAGTSPDKVDQARQGFADILEELRTKPLAAELLEAGCNFLEGEYLRSRQSLDARSAEACTELLYGYPENFTQTLIEKARALTPEDLRRAVETWFKDGFEAVLMPVASRTQER